MLTKTLISLSLFATFIVTLSSSIVNKWYTDHELQVLNNCKDIVLSLAHKENEYLSGVRAMHPKKSDILNDLHLCLQEDHRYFQVCFPSISYRFLRSRINNYKLSSIVSNIFQDRFCTENATTSIESYFTGFDIPEKEREDIFKEILSLLDRYSFKDDGIVGDQDTIKIIRVLRKYVDLSKYSESHFKSIMKVFGEFTENHRPTVEDFAPFLPGLSYDARVFLIRKMSREIGVYVKGNENIKPIMEHYDIWE